MLDVRITTSPALCRLLQAGADLLRVLLLRADGRADPLHHVRGEEHLPGGGAEGRCRHGPRLQVGSQLVAQTVRLASPVDLLSPMTVASSDKDWPPLFWWYPYPERLLTYGKERLLWRSRLTPVPGQLGSCVLRTPFFLKMHMILFLDLTTQGYYNDKFLLSIHHFGKL